MNTHELKTWPGPFTAIARGEKHHEIRKADRPFAVGDVLHLREWDPHAETYSGRSLHRTVTYLTPGGQWGLPDGLCVMSLGWAASPEPRGLSLAEIATKAEAYLGLESVEGLRSGLRIVVENLRAASPEPEGERCTGLSATWCPIHGDCKCEGEDRASYQCPLHSPTSSHGPASPPSPAPEAAPTLTVDVRLGMLPTGVAEFVDKDGKVVGRIVNLGDAPAPSPAKERP